MDKETLELILDKLEQGQFCNCLVDQDASKVRLFKEVMHYKNCIGKIIVSELLYEAKWQSITLTK